MHASIIVRSLIFVVFGLAGWWIIIGNFVIAYRWIVHREHSSWIPFLGGFLAFFGMGACPLRGVQKLAWLPLLVDCGYMVASVVFGLAGLVVRRFFRGKKDDADPPDPRTIRQ